MMKRKKIKSSWVPQKTKIKKRKKKRKKMMMKIEILNALCVMDTKLIDAEKYGREPTTMEVFTYTHTKDHDVNTFVDKRALGINGVKRRGKDVASGLRHHSFIAAQHLTLLQPPHDHGPTTVPRRLVHYGCVLMSRRDKLQSLKRMSCGCPVSMVLVLLPLILYCYKSTCFYSSASATIVSSRYQYCR
ncbi:hypothetical protein JCGZ_06359 [Jatropha curcas]|uniref:Uncharacterized protein n=1 Tax=Jatropha curcas TaxID=180498 RepID=A0A067KP00_JATCU|nr:hypothetical protein JCGZ_06359 [Jatropha curcas]